MSNSGLPLPFLTPSLLLSGTISSTHSLITTHQSLYGLVFAGWMAYDAVPATANGRPYYRHTWMSKMAKLTTTLVYLAHQVMR